LDEAADLGYKNVRSSPYAVDAAAVGDLSRNIQAELNAQGRTERFAPETHGVLADYQKAHPGTIATGGNLATFGKPLTKPLKTSLTRERQQRRQKPSRSWIASLRSLLRRVLWLEALPSSPLPMKAREEIMPPQGRSETVQNELDTAHRNAAVANSGRNVDNAQRQRINALTKSERKSQGFNDDELAQMDRVIFGTAAGNTMRTVGNMLGGGGGLGAAIVGGVGATFNPFLAATPLAGALLKKGADFSTLRQIKALDEMVRSRSPLAQEMPVASGLTPAEQLQQAALIKALMSYQPTN
jgi:hypothetical protein